METYANGSVGASLTIQTTNSFRDVSFSSYLNQAEEHMIRKLTNQASDPTNDHHYRKKPEEDEEEEEELGVFGAEKYFKEEIEDVKSKDDERINRIYDENIKKFDNFDHGYRVKVKTDHPNTRTPSVRSNMSCNSRIGLLPRSKPPLERIERGSKTRTILASFGCNCINKKSTQIDEKRILKSNPNTKMFDFDSKTSPLSSKLTERTTRNDYFTFPVLNSNGLNLNCSYSNSSNTDRSNLKFGNLAGKVVDGEHNRDRLSLGRKLSLLNDWDVDIPTSIPTEDEMYIPSSVMYNNDIDSDSSSDLFEIESFSTTGNNSFVAPRKSNGYAPSEVSVDWSVVTASAADFSVVSDYEDVRTSDGGWKISGWNDRVWVNIDEQKRRPGILSGCASHKAVRVAGGEYKVGGGRAGPTGGRRRLSDSIAVGSMFRGGII